MRDKTFQEKQILTEQVKQLYSLAPLGFIATVMNSIIVFFVMQEVIPLRTLCFWLAAVVGVTAPRVVGLVCFRRTPDERLDAAAWRGRFIIGLCASGVAWGSIIFLPITVSVAHEVFLAFVLGGMAAGATSTYSKVKWGYPAFSIPALVPLGVHFFLEHGPFHQAMGIMTFLFFVLLWRISQHNYMVNRTSLLLRFENQEMIERLQRAKDDVDTLNHQLMAQIDAKLEAEAELRRHRDALEMTVQERTKDLVTANEQLKKEIEERKEVEQALRESRERLDLAQRAGRVGVFDWDMTSGRVIVTRQMEALFGLQPGQFEGTYEAWARLLVPADLEDLQAQLARWLEERVEQVEFEYRFLRGQEIRWMAATVRISYQQDGTAVRMIGTNIDVTDSKEVQQELMTAKDAAEAGSMAKSEFLANMSHEMRTPLAGVLGMIRLVLDMKIGEEERKLLEMARRSAESLLRIIGDVLDFSRLEAGVMKFDKRRFSIPETVQSAVEVVSLSALEKGIELTSSVDEPVREAEGDEGRLRQLLVNLLGNAVKFTERGKIELAARSFEDPEVPGQDFILFSVRDTGVGIPADKLEKIFGKFTQIDSSLTRRYGGTGLGLALSRQIVEKSGGRIWAESREGIGSTFYFTLPAGKQPGSGAGG